MPRHGSPHGIHGSLTSQSEDYLEVIAQLQKEDRVARAKDIAERMGVTRGTVTSALKVLKEKELINYEPYSYITLTPKGKKIAAEIIHRHRVLTRYLREVLRLSPEVAEENACRAEHILDSEVIERLSCFLEFMEECPRLGPVWKDALERFCTSGGGDTGDCKACLVQSLDGLQT